MLEAPTAGAATGTGPAPAARFNGPVRTDQEVIDGWAEGISGSLVRDDRVVHVEHIWGTAVTIKLAGTRGREPAALAAIEGCRRFFTEVDRVFSTHQPLTEVSAVPGGAGSPRLHTPRTSRRSWRPAVTCAR